MPLIMNYQITEMTQNTVHLFITAIIVLLLSACQPGQSPLIKSQPAEPEVVAEETAGDYLLAAEKYLTLAQDETGALQAQYQLKAAELYARMQQMQQSQSALDLVQANLLPADKKVSYALLAAQLALDVGLAEKALQALETVAPDSLSTAQQISYYQYKIQAYDITQNWLEKANSHLKLDPLLSDQAQLEHNRTQLWQTLMQLTPQVLDLFNPGIPPADDSGWFALAYTIKAYQSKPEVLQIALEDWKRSYPNHPADPKLYQSVLAAGTHLPDQLSSIAILLPASGPYTEAANAIRQGIIAEHYSHASADKIQFYDINTDEYSGGSNVLSAYQRAVEDGADIVIGPLQKSSVEQLATQGELTVPVLALNRTDDSLSRPNMYQFGLAPEDDAIAIANYATQQHYQRAVMLTPANSWGDRVADAFISQWRQNGGQVIQHARYDESKSDFSDTLIPLMGLDVSKQRYQQLKSVLSRSMDFEPRRRQDIDFVFLAARPLKARQLVPQLKFHRSGKLPIIATSHAYEGTPNPQQDIDLNDLIITDMPWIVGMESSNDSSYPMFAQQARNSGALARLFAMGVDAYRLVPQLNAMSRDSAQTIQGATGQLHINARGQVERDMSWAQFKQGEINRLE